MAHASPPPDGAADARSRAVVERLRAATDPAGFVPFDRFMEISLYAEEVGYYHRPESPLGTGGDFYTAAHVDPVFAGAIGERVRRVRAELGADTTFELVELGPGDGTLAAELVRAFANDVSPPEYVLIDRSGGRAREARARAEAAAPDYPVRTAGAVADLGPFSGVVIANELLDAQPARRLRWNGTEWRELGVRLAGDRVEEAEGAVAGPVPGAPLPVGAAPGTVVEVSGAAEGIVREIADHLTAGAAILIDFGSEEAALLRAHPGGTAAGVREHRFLPDVYASPGAADVSVFVNFDRIRSAARTAGLRELAYRPLAEALVDWGLPALRESALAAARSSEERVRRQLAIKNLLFGFETFRALELAPPAAATRAT